MLQKADIEKLRFTGGLWIADGPFNGSGILFEMPDSILRFVRNRECTKEMDVLSGCRIFRRSGQGQIAADPLKI